MLQQGSDKINLYALTPSQPLNVLLLVQKLNCVGWEGNGNDLADSLSRASGTPCKYSIGVPLLLQRLFMNDLYHMV